MSSKEHRLAVGKRLQTVRGTRDQRTFAEAVDSVQQTISKYERGEIPRSWLFLARLRTEEGVDLNQLLAGHGETTGTEERHGGNGRQRDDDRAQQELPADAEEFTGFGRPRLVSGVK
ncbi:MAG TPA: hypothetical protein VM737_05265 [Gemmatimonadota bacterium]|nr:hypothetical protein [Gemmatimonadota bacterium]